MPTPLPAAPQPKIALHRGRWVVVLLLLCLVAMAVMSWRFARALGASSIGFQSPEMAAAQYSAEDVIGDLGGMPVKISKHVAEYVEYEGDPGWGPPREGPSPVRTYASRLESFGFQVRYPDMAMLTTSEMWADMKSYTIYNTPWVRIGVTTGDMFPGRGFMSRPHISNGKLGSEYWWENYEKTGSRPFGLDEYQLSGADPRTGHPASDSREAITVYLKRDAAGNVVTRIDCSKAQHEAAPCTQEWSMEEQDVHAWIRVHYRRGLLAEWRTIKERVTEMILNFRADI